MRQARTQRLTLSHQNPSPNMAALTPNWMGMKNTRLQCANGGFPGKKSSFLVPVVLQKWATEAVEY